MTECITHAPPALKTLPRCARGRVAREDAYALGVAVYHCDLEY